MKKLLLFVVVSLFSTFITNGQKLTVMNDLESDNTDLNIEFRNSFDGGILFSYRKKFTVDDIYCISDGTIENTKETTENPGVNYNSDLKGITMLEMGIYTISKELTQVRKFID